MSPKIKYSVLVFTDCIDSDAKSRQVARWQSAFGNIPVNCFGVKKSIEASFCVVDVIYATRLPKNIARKWKSKPIIFGNIAPRTEKRYENGAPFCLGWTADGILVIGTPDVFVLPLKEGLIKDVYVTDPYHVCRAAGVEEDEALRISKSQFRSLDYVPLLAYWLEIENIKIPCEKIDIPSNKFDNEIAFIDNFGNVKSTVKKSDFPLSNLSEIPNGVIELAVSGESLQFVPRLKDVSGEAVTQGSSGAPGDGYLEIVIQGGNASKSEKLQLSLEEKAFEISIYEQV